MQHLPDDILAYCGLLCGSCPIHLASLEPDKSRQHAMRIEIARISNEKYAMNLNPAEVTDCDGCRADTGKIFSACLACGIRKCAQQKELESCAYCIDYPCIRLEKIFQDDPEARVRLEKNKYS